jgi:acyl-CoA thioesterase YciA
MTAPTAEPVIRITAMPADANAYGDIFGGWLLSLMDMGAGLIAARHSRGRAVTVAMDAVQFHLPVKVGDEVSVYGTLVSVGRSSMVIATEAWRRPRHEEAETKVTEAQFTFVAVDPEGRPRPANQE